MQPKKKVGILRGGSEFTEQSLRLGKKVAALLEQDAEVIDFLVDTEGQLHMGGRPFVPAMVDHFVDKIIDVTYAIPAEGVNLTGVMRDLGLPTMAASDLERSLFSNRALMQKYLTPYDILFPHAVSTTIPEDYNLEEVVAGIHKVLPPPYRVWDGVSWHGAKTNDELLGTLEKVERNTNLYIQERPLGHRAQFLAIRNFRGEDVYISLSVTMSGTVLPVSSHYRDQIHNELEMLMHLFANTDVMLASYIIKPGKKPMLASLDFVHLPDDHPIVTAIRKESGITDEELKRWYLQ